MCRFVVYTGPPRTARPLVFGGTHPLLEQSWAPRELLHGHVNADGYGVAWYHDGQPVRIARTRPIWQDPDLERLLETIRSSSIVAALRNATPGIPQGLDGVAPLLHGRWSFVLNGFIEDFHGRFLRAFHASLPDHLYAALRGTSDTEALFLAAVAELEKGASPARALARTVERTRRGVRREGLTTHLNMVLADGERLAVTRASSVDETNSLYLARGGPLASGGVLVASEALDEEDAWDPVPPQSLVEVDRDGTVELTSL